MKAQDILCDKQINGRKVLQCFFDKDFVGRLFVYSLLPLSVFCQNQNIIRIPQRFRQIKGQLIQRILAIIDQREHSFKSGGSAFRTVFNQENLRRFFDKSKITAGPDKQIGEQTLSAVVVKRMRPVPVHSLRQPG